MDNDGYGTKPLAAPEDPDDMRLCPHQWEKSGKDWGVPDVDSGGRALLEPRIRQGNNVVREGCGRLCRRCRPRLVEVKTQCCALD